MGSITADGERWRAHVYKRGIRKSRTFDSKTAAREWISRTEYELTSGEGDGTGRMRWHAVIDRYVREVCPRRKGGETEAKRLAAVKRQIPDRPIGRLTTPVLARWRDERLGQVQGTSVRREMNLVRAVLEKARKEWKLIAVNPITDVDKPKGKRPRQRLIEEHEIEGVTKALGWAPDVPVVLKKQEVAVMFLIALETGMRAGEIPKAVVRGKVAHLAGSKNGDARDVPLSKRAVELFASVKKWTVTEGSRDGMFRDARDAAGLSGFTFHDSRAYACTKLAKKVDVLTLAKIIGHRDPRSLMIYYRESAEDIAARLG